MSETVIKIENLSKEYRLGQIGTGTISHDLNRWWHKIRGKEDPYLKIGETNDREKKGDSDYVYALKNINLEVKKGEILGIIGKNGAGKSTLLKILSKVTGPTKGSIKTKGRIASLLEVGTGFHPELTGRENIYMNGTIMGMTRKEIDSKIDEIIHFAGIERYVDTPTKRYSSGMTVRLGFAVAAHLEPDILVVDEVLAVGDAEFQKKAIGKMKDISEGGGRTVLFVSHNMSAIANLCSRAVLVENGNLNTIGSVEDVINCYFANNQLEASCVRKSDDIVMKSASIVGNATDGNYSIEEKLNIKVSIYAFPSFKQSYHINLFVNTNGICTFVSCSEKIERKAPHNSIFTFSVPENLLNDNDYTFDLMIVTEGRVVAKYVNIAIAKMRTPSKVTYGWQGKMPGSVRPKLECDVTYE